jgi:hypothetical protein
MPNIKVDGKDGVIFIEFANGNYSRNKNHHYIQYSSKPIEGYLPEAAYEICRMYGGNQNKQQWKKEKRTFTLSYDDLKTMEKKESIPYNYNLISNQLRKSGFFKLGQFNFPNSCCSWLDCATNMKVTFHKKVENGEKPWINFGEGGLNESFGENFPIKPIIKREGHIYSTFLPALMRRIIKKRDEIIQNSFLAFTDDWIFDIKDLIIDSISLVDITLNTIYIKAQYNPNPKWKFDFNKLGTRMNRRLKDKLKWIYQITGNSINIEKEKQALENFRVLRNHFNHFDPPCFALTLEETTTILNQIMEIGMILVKIRQAINVPSSVELVNFILQKKVYFNPEQEFLIRSPAVKEDGYLTSIW